MKNSPEEYADDLVEKYYFNIPSTVSDYDIKCAIQCAIIDVENTINYVETWGDTADDDLEYFNKVLTILKK